MSKKSRHVHHRPTGCCKSTPQPPAPPPEPAGTGDLAASPGNSLRVVGVHVLIMTLLCSVVAGLYAWTVDFPMVFDDAVYLQNNPLVKDASSFGYMSDLREFVARPVKMGLEPDLATNFILRPFAYATFHLNYLLDKFEPRWYRAFNIAAHAGASAAFYALLVTILGMGRLGASRSRGSVIFMAATAALLFAVHPLAIESVTYIVQRFTSLGAFFFLVSLWLYFLARTFRFRACRVLCTLSAVAVMILGMLTKESTVTAPLMAVALDWLLVGASFRQALRRAWPLLACLPIVPGLVLLTSWAREGGVLKLGSAINLTNSIDEPLHYFDYLFTQATVVADYLRLLVWPAGLNLDPEWPLYHSLLAWPVLSSLALFATLGLVCWLWYRTRPASSHAPVVLVSALWFFGTIIISSGLVPLPDLKAEHRSYLPSIGFFTIAACLFDRLRHLTRCRYPAILAVLACSTALGTATWQRNAVWGNKIALWKDTAEKSPHKYRVWNNLGEAYSKEGRYEDALRCFKKTVELEPRCWTAHVNLAGILNGLNRYPEAFEVSMHLLKKNEQAAKSVDVRYNVAVSHLGLGRVDQGTALLEELVRLAPNHRPSHVVLGLVYSQSHRPQLALEEWHRAAALQPADNALASLMQKEQLKLIQSSPVSLQTVSALQ